MTSKQIKIGDTVEFTDACGVWVNGAVISHNDEFGFYNVEADDKVYSLESECFKTINGERT